MSPEVSRRVADAMYTKNPDIMTRRKLTRAAQDADTFEDLPRWVRQYVEDAEKESLTAAADVLTGAMIALVPSATDVKRLAVDGGEPPEELHMTLAYLGDAVLYDDVMRGRITAMLSQLLASSAPIEANGFGVAMWNPGAPDPAWVLNVGEAVDEETREQGGEWDLESVHELVAEMLDEMGAPVPDQHEPWSPHVCLVYSTDTDLMPELLKRVGPLTFDRLRIAFAGDVLDITLA